MWVPNDHGFVQGEIFDSTGVEHHYRDLPKILPPQEHPGEPLANHAPHIVKKDGLFYVVFGPSPIRLAVSKDLSQWKLKGELFSQEGGSRDPNLLLHDGTYYLSYCSERNVLMRTSNDLLNWSEPKTIFTANSFDPESPSLVFHHDTFYLFVCSWYGNRDYQEIQGAYHHRTYVNQSDSLLNFGVGDEKEITTLNADAPEIFQGENG
jgi:beta-fructofuranosidase